MFAAGYDNHPLSSESNMTPIQLWLTGLPTCQSAAELTLNDENILSYGIDYNGPLPSFEYDGDTWNDMSVQVPEIPCPLTDENAYDAMTSRINPLQYSSCYGIDIYTRTVEIVHELQADCFHS